jgi:hypothetical protein
MGKKPALACTTFLVTAVALTGCESCNLFGDNSPWKQNQVAQSSTTPGGTNAWANQPRGWTTNPANQNLQTGTTTNPASSNLAGAYGTATAGANTAASGTNFGSGLGSRVPATTTGLSSLSPSSGTTLGQGAAPTTGVTDRGNTSNAAWPSDATARTPNNPQATSPTPDWNRDTTSAAGRNPMNSGQPSTPSTPAAFNNAPGTSGNGPTGPATMDSRYQTQYPDAPAASNVKTMPPPGQDE